MFWSEKQPKIKTMFMYFWLNCCDKNHHVEKISIAVKNIDHLFHLTSEMIDADRLHLFLLLWQFSNWWQWVLKQPRKRCRINCLQKGTNPEIVDLFWIEKVPSLKNISCPWHIDYFLWRTGWLLLPNNFDVQFHWSGYNQYQPCSKCVP